MKQNSKVSIVFLSCTLVLAPCNVPAQGRTPTPRKSQEKSPKARAAEMAKLESWLGRLAGKFRVEIMPPIDLGTACDVPRADRPAFAVCTPPRNVRPPTATPPREGSAECRVIGPGPGVSCVFDFDDADRQYPIIGPKVILFGLDPDEPGIRLMEVFSLVSSTYSGRGSLHGDTVSFEVQCVKQPAPWAAPAPWATCKRNERFRAWTDGKRIEIYFRENWTVRMGQAVITGDVQIVLQRVAEDGM